MKKVILSLDVEDWYHLDYFDRSECSASDSLLDGLESYVELLESLSLPSSFFVLGEIAEKRLRFFTDLVAKGHDVGSHGWDHVRPMTMSLETFREDVGKCSKIMQEINGTQPFGYRAPCFSLDRERLEILRDSGFAYDASRIDFGDHPLYGSIDMSGFDKLAESIFRDDTFFEFEATTLRLLGKNIPISGGGYLRLVPWPLMRQLLLKHIAKSNIYVFYIHPFELSQRPAPVLPHSTPLLTRYRFSLGRKEVKARIERLVDMFCSNGYQFTTFNNLRSDFLGDQM